MAKDNFNEQLLSWGCHGSVLFASVFDPGISSKERGVGNHGVIDHVEHFPLARRSRCFVPQLALKVDFSPRTLASHPIPQEQFALMTCASEWVALGWWFTPHEVWYFPNGRHAYFRRAGAHPSFLYFFLMTFAIFVIFDSFSSAHRAPHEVSMPVHVTLLWSTSWCQGLGWDRPSSSASRR